MVLLSVVGVARTEMCAGWWPGSLKLPSKKPQLNSSAQVLEIVKSKSKLKKSTQLAVAQVLEIVKSKSKLKKSTQLAVAQLE